jgi:hypothetical protein
MATKEQARNHSERQNFLGARTGPERERECSDEGANEQGGVGERGASSIGGRGRAEVAGKCATWVHPRQE